MAHNLVYPPDNAYTTKRTVYKSTETRSTTTTKIQRSSEAHEKKIVPGYRFYLSLLRYAQ